MAMASLEEGDLTYGKDLMAGVCQAVLKTKQEDVLWHVPS
jgi:hypothetical protein